MVKKEKMMKEEKKVKNSSFKIGLTILLSVLVFVLCVMMFTKEIGKILEQKKTMDEFEKYYSSDELSLIYYSAEGCSFCELQTPILERIAKDYNLKYLDLNKTKLSDSQKKKILEKLGIEDATPTTVVVKKGKVIAVQSGYVQGNKYVEFLIESGILEDDSKYMPEKNLTFVSYDKFKELKSLHQLVVVVIGKATCDNCTVVRPILSNLANAYEIPIYYMTLDYMTSEERLSLVEDLEAMKFSEELFVEEGKLYTPTLLIIKNNKIIDYTIGLGNITSYTKLFKDTGVITE